MFGKITVTGKLDKKLPNSIRLIVDREFNLIHADASLTWRKNSSNSAAKRSRLPFHVINNRIPLEHDHYSRAVELDTICIGRKIPK